MRRHSPGRARSVLLVAAAVVAATSCSDRQAAPTAPGAIGGAPSRSASGFVLTPSSLDWQQQARDLIAANKLSPLAAGRVLAALSVAEYRAVMSTNPVDGDGLIPAEGIGKGGRSALEAERGAVAGASAQVLTFFFPAAAASLEQLVKSKGNAGAGNVHPEFTRGVALGRSAGDALVTRSRNDGFTAPWDGIVRTGPGVWIPNGTPAGATFGAVQPYLLTSGSQFRPPPPPAFGSAAYLTDLQEIRTISDTRTAAQLASALFWNFPAGTFTPVGFWNNVAAGYIVADGLDERAATHAFALMHAAMMDAAIGCWDAKYFYWMIRPPQADPLITLAFALPNHPSYPSGHSCASAAAATVLSSVFPERAAEVTDVMTQAGLSRMYAGIHYRFDIDAGQALGKAVGRWAIAQDQGAGSWPRCISECSCAGAALAAPAQDIGWPRTSTKAAELCLRLDPPSCRIAARRRRISGPSGSRPCHRSAIGGQSQVPSRRQFLRAAVVAAGAVAALPVIRAAVGVEPSTDAAGARVLAHTELLDALGPDVVREIGQGYRAMVRAEDDAGALRARLGARPVASAIRDDFAGGRTVVVDGWVLSATEARQCGLYSLLAS